MNDHRPKLNHENPQNITFKTICKLKIDFDKPYFRSDVFWAFFFSPSSFLNDHHPTLNHENPKSSPLRTICNADAPLRQELIDHHEILEDIPEVHEHGDQEVSKKDSKRFMRFYQYVISPLANSFVVKN